MKNAPLAKGVRFSESRFERRQKETTTPKAFIKPDHQPEDRPERSLPYHSPHGFHTEAELAEFIATHTAGGVNYEA